MTRRLLRLAVVAATAGAFALAATPAGAYWCPVEEATIGLYVCV